MTTEDKAGVNKLPCLPQVPLAQKSVSPKSLHWPPKATVTKCHTLGGSTQQKLIFSQRWKPKV